MLVFPKSYMDTDAEHLCADHASADWLLHHITSVFLLYIIRIIKVKFHEFPIWKFAFINGAVGWIVSVWAYPHLIIDHSWAAVALQAGDAGVWDINKTVHQSAYRPQGVQVILEWTIILMSTADEGTIFIVKKLSC